MFIRVDLPDPLGPIMATNSPFSIVKLRSSSATVVASPTPNSLLNPKISMTGCITFIIGVIANRGQLFFHNGWRFGTIQGYGEVAEWPKAHAWKACMVAR